MHTYLRKGKCLLFPHHLHDLQSYPPSASENIHPTFETLLPSYFSFLKHLKPHLLFMNEKPSVIPTRFFVIPFIEIALLLLFSLSFLLYHDLKSLLNTYLYTSALLSLLALAFRKQRFVHLCLRPLVQGQRYNPLF